MNTQTPSKDVGPFTRDLPMVDLKSPRNVEGKKLNAIKTVLVEVPATVVFQVEVDSSMNDQLVSSQALDRLFEAEIELCRIVSPRTGYTFKISLKEQLQTDDVVILDEQIGTLL